jgi:hypothetical protein
MIDEVDRALDWVYSDGSTRRRAARALLAELKRRDVDRLEIQLADAHLGRLLAMRAEDLDDLPEPTHAIGWQRPVEDALWFLGQGGQEYWHILKVTRRPPVEVLRLTPGRAASADGLREFAGSAFSRTEILPELGNWIVRRT